MRYQLTLKSRNKKTGPIPVSTTSDDTCPDVCPFKAGGCYAKGGPLAIVWRRVDDQGSNLAEFCDAISALPAGQLWRHNQAGDLPGVNGTINGRDLNRIVKANKGKHGYTYTHKPTTAKNRRAIAKANASGFTVNLSANNADHADQLVALGIGPVVTVVPSNAKVGSLKTEAGNKIVICPASYRDDVTCSDCGLCQRQRKAIVGFPAHGQAHKQASAIANSTTV